MANFDQAEGLRRMLFGTKPRFVTFLSALTNSEKNATLVNLAAGLARLGNDVVLLDARYRHLDNNGSKNRMGVPMWMEMPMCTTLVDVARQKCTIDQAIKGTAYGFKVSSFCRSQAIPPHSDLNDALLFRLNKLVEKIGHSADIVLADGELNADNGLCAEALDEGEITVLVTNHSDSIQAAYGLIKRAHARYGRRSYSILVTGANQLEAQRVYEAMASVAGNFLSVPLTCLGHIPQDDYLRRASRYGRSVIDVFPTAGTALAFSRLAQHLIELNEYDYSLA